MKPTSSGTIKLPVSCPPRRWRQDGDGALTAAATELAVTASAAKRRDICVPAHATRTREV